MERHNTTLEEIKANPRKYIEMGLEKLPEFLNWMDCDDYELIEGDDKDEKAENLLEKLKNMSVKSKEQRLEELEKELQSLKQEIKEEKEFKVGDIVKITNKRPGYWNIAGKMDCFLSKIVKIETVEGDSFTFTGSGKWKFRLEDVKRKATPQEIEEYNNIDKLPQINGYEGKYYKHLEELKYGCGVLLKEWFNSSNNRKIKSLVLDSGVEINEEQMNQIRRYFDSKN